MSTFAAPGRLESVALDDRRPGRRCPQHGCLDQAQYQSGRSYLPYRCRKSVHLGGLHPTARRDRRRTVDRHHRRQLRQCAGRIGDGSVQDRAASQPRRAGSTQRPLGGLDDLETSICAWVSWFNTERIHSELGDCTPDEVEASFYASQAAWSVARLGAGSGANGNDTLRYDSQVETTCAGPGCMNPLVPAGTGRPARYCSSACRVPSHRAKLAAREPVTVEVDFGSASSGVVAHQIRVFMVRMRLVGNSL